MGALALLIAVVILAVTTGDGLGFLEGDEGAGVSYLAIFLLVAGDAVIPILPGETALNSASVLASRDQLELGLVILMGALGAIVGDSALYWLARAGSSRLQEQMERAESDKRVQWVFAILGRRAPLLIVLGRYVPGVRFVVNATMGLTRMPYGTFLPWSVVGGTIWATYTCLLAYAVGTALAEFPLASIVISGAVTTVLLAAVYWLEKRRSQQEARQTLTDVSDS